MTEYIGFSGHRDCLTNESNFDRIQLEHPGATWVHGDSWDGFDAQVKAYAIKHNIPQEGIPPKYRFVDDTQAPIIRNEEIVVKVSKMYLCYDGTRKSGGTYSCIGFARKHKKSMEYLPYIKVRRYNYGKFPPKEGQNG